MNKLVGLLAATTALFAGTTVYFWEKAAALEDDARHLADASGTTTPATGERHTVGAAASTTAGNARG